MKTPIHGQGHGVAGHFAGLEAPYGLEDFAKIVMLPVPFDKTTTYQKGTDKGPAALIEASRNLELYDIETDSQVYLHGIHTAPPLLAENSQEMLDLTYKTCKRIVDQDKFLVVIGGEHSISYAPIRACGEHFKNLTVLQFDAHADLQPTYEGDPWSHASVIARVKELSQIKRVVSVGIRSMAIEEKAHSDPANTFLAHQLDENDHWMEKVLDKLEGPIYITFDLDVFDSSLMPSTGTPEPGGLYWNQTLKLLKKVAQEKRIVGFDVVELCPTPNNIAPDYLAAKLVYKLLSYIFHYSKDKL
ncbi:MAG: agmatinase [Parachlamydiaceae bacterium]|nr:agmatinase [Parachlamydiaceae bacterium]